MREREGREREGGRGRDSDEIGRERMREGGTAIREGEEEFHTANHSL